MRQKYQIPIETLLDVVTEQRNAREDELAQMTAYARELEKELQKYKQGESEEQLSQTKKTSK